MLLGFFILHVYSSGFCFGTKQKIKSQAIWPSSREAASFPRQREKQSAEKSSIPGDFQGPAGDTVHACNTPFIPGLTLAVQPGNFEFNFSNWKYGSISFLYIILTERKRECKKVWLKTENLVIVSEFPSQCFF